jgi:hypothetical protein
MYGTEPVMSSSPHIADPCAIDLAHLRQSTFGDRNLEREVLSLFADQAVRLLGQLVDAPPDAAALAHTLKGSARAIGAFGVAEAAAAAELVSHDAGAAPGALADLKAAVQAACAAIQTILQRS